MNFRIILIQLVALITFTSFSQIKEGHATHFDALGSPYGGCGVPTEFVGTDAFVALNVFNKANTGSSDFTRPITEANSALMGEFKNGKNCGRWVKVTILEDCVGGANSGELGKGFCNEPNTVWANDSYTDAVQYMIVTDACGDNNGWCRESPNHLDLHTSSVNSFEKDGEPVKNMLPSSFNNRKIAWEYVESPNYKGDIEIYLMKDSFQWWKSIFITNLKNGIHNVQQKVNSTWIDLEMNSDMGQAFIINTPDLSSFTIRVMDADNEWINTGREYTFTFPSACGNKCANAGTKTNYQTFDPVVAGTDYSFSQNEISLFPNPTSTRITIKNHQGENWMLFNQYGKKEMEGSNTEIDLKEIASGVYFLEINHQKHKVIKID